MKTTVKVEETAQLVVEINPHAAALPTFWETSANTARVMASVIMVGRVCSPAMGRDSVAVLHASLATTVRWTNVTTAVMASVFLSISTSLKETSHADAPVAESNPAVTHVKDTVLMANALSAPQISHSASVLLVGKVIAVRIPHGMKTLNPVAEQLR